MKYKCKLENKNENVKEDTIGSSTSRLFNFSTFALLHVEYKHPLFAAVLQLRLAKRLPSSRCNLRLEMLARDYHTLQFTQGNITPGRTEKKERKKERKNLRGQMELKNSLIN